jgi:hypothetical protein
LTHAKIWIALYWAPVSLPCTTEASPQVPSLAWRERDCRTVICSPSKENAIWNSSPKDHAGNEDGEVDNADNAVEDCIEASWLRGGDKVVQREDEVEYELCEDQSVPLLSECPDWASRSEKDIGRCPKSGPCKEHR